MKYSTNAIATLMATLTGSLVAVGTTKCPTAACSQNTIDTRAVCGWSSPQTALLASTFTHFGIHEGDEASFFEIPLSTDEFRYEDSCGRDPLTGEIYRNNSSDAKNGSEIESEYLSTLGTCELTINENPTNERTCPIAIQDKTVPHVAAEADVSNDVNYDDEEYYEYENADSDAYDSYDAESDKAEPANSVEVNLNSQLELQNAQESLVELWLQVKPLWTNSWESLRAHTQRAAWIAKRSAPAIPIVVLSEAPAMENNTAESIAAEYAAAEWAAAQPSLTAEEIEAAAAQAAEVYSRMLPASPEPTELSYAEEYQRNYELIPLEPSEEDRAPAAVANPTTADEYNREANVYEFEAYENAYEEAYDGGEATDDAFDSFSPEFNAEEQGELESESPSEAMQELRDCIDALWIELRDESQSWQEDLQELLNLGNRVVRTSRTVYQYARELAWEQESQTLDQRFNEYCSLVEFDNLVMGINQDAEAKLQSQLVQGLRQTGHFLLDCADQLDAQLEKGPYISLRPGEHR
jgi:hypothetical protein